MNEANFEVGEGLPNLIEIIDLRLISPDCLRALLDEEKGVWRDSLYWDYSTTASMVLRYLESRALTGYAAVENDRAVGYAFYVVESCKGLVGDAFVGAAYANSSLGVRLATHVIETLQATPGLRRIEAQLINLDNQAIRNHFLSQGFQVHDRQFLHLSLQNEALADGARATGNLSIGLAVTPAVSIVPWDARWFQAASELILASYRGHVDSQISDQYRTQAGAARFLDNLVHFPGCGTFLPDVSLLALYPDGARHKLAGMILTSIVSDEVAHITQLCVAPEQQEKGLGRRLILEVTRRLQARGFKAATLTVTVSNTRAVQLYRRLGFISLNTFPAFAWDAPVQTPQFTRRKIVTRL
jgi:ribosomal protein S18 acetylase RimI-like enzyme